jgi:exopolyphosphatase/guanosine-5'-triphosphate,3'-diphosphate pyrophosphatase
VRVGIIDCGTNTIRLLVAEDAASAAGAGEPWEQAGSPLRTLYRGLRFVRLGQGVDATHRFHPDALARTFAAVDDYAAVLRRWGVDRVRFLATSAARDAQNRGEFFAGVRSRLGTDPDIITGTEEARLSFLGALAGGPLTDPADPADLPGAPAPVLVTDIGGGSTEFILGDATGTIRAAQSLDIGSVRLRERHLHGDPPTAAEIAAARATVTALLDGLAVPLAAPDLTWIGVAGTNTSIAAMTAGLAEYDPALVHNSTVPLEDLYALSERLLRLSVADTRRLYPLLEPLRAEVICAGVLIAAEAARRVGRPLVVRETDILDGAALDLMRTSP